MDPVKELELLRESWTEHLDRLYLIYEIANSIASISDLNNLLDHVAVQAFLLLESEAGSVMLVNPCTKRLEFRVIKGETAEVISKVNFTLESGEGIAGAVAQSNQPMMVTNASQDARLKKELGWLTAFVPQAVLCAPLTVQGKTIGVMEAISRKKLTFSARDRDFLCAIASITALVIDSADMRREMFHAGSFKDQILEKLTDGLLAVDTSGKVTQVNSRAVDMLGLAGRTVIGESYASILAEENELLQHLELALIKGKTTSGDEYTMENTGRHIFFSTFTMTDAAGAISGAGLAMQELVLRRHT